MPNIRYLGHSSFYISSNRGTSIVIDPFGTGIPYTFPDVTADVVVMSHEHPDHNACWRVGGSPMTVKRTSDFLAEFELPVKRTDETMTFYGIPTFHDRFAGKKKGPNTVFYWYLDGLKFCHLGDLGHILREQDLQRLGEIDVLFVPVGGGIVLTSSEAALVVNQLKAKIVFPMHFKTKETEALSWLEEPVENFLEKFQDVEHLYALATTVDASKRPASTVIKVLERG